nr:energy transducer TonB [uncultured Carboxylicivirga sp.]
MKYLLLIFWLGVMTMGIHAQNTERSKKQDERVPAKLQTDQIQKISEITILPQSSISYFLMNTIEYPENSVAKMEEGQVVVKFIIEPDGAIRDIKVINSVSEAIDEQVINGVQKTSGKWLPAYENGKPVESEHKLYITFDIMNNLPLNEQSIDHFTKGMKLIYQAELYEKENPINNNKKVKKLNRQYKKALYHFDEAAKYQAEEGSIFYWQSYAYQKLGDMQRMEEKLKEYQATL